MQYDKPFHHELKMAAKTAATNGKMAISLLISNLKQHNLSLGICFHVQGINWNRQQCDRMSHYTINQRWLPKWLVPNNNIAISLLIDSPGSLFSYTGNLLILVEIQCDNLFNPKTKMAVKMVVPNCKMATTLFVFNIEPWYLTL